MIIRDTQNIKLHTISTKAFLKMLKIQSMTPTRRRTVYLGVPLDNRLMQIEVRYGITKEMILQDYVNNMEAGVPVSFSMNLKEDEPDGDHTSIPQAAVAAQL